MPAVSIVVPVFNTEPYLEACLDSILRQSYTDFELLLIDDGSSDASGAICDAYALKDARVCVYHTGNKGVSSARNLGLDHAAGQWIMFVDSDDELTEGVLMTLTEGGSDFSVGGLLRVQNGQVQEIVYASGNCFSGKEKEAFLDEAFSVMTLMEGPWGKLYNTGIIRRKGMRFNESLHYGEDKLFVFSYLLHAGSCRIESSPVYIQKRHQGSLSSDTTSAGHLKPLFGFLVCYVDIVRSYQAVFSCRAVKQLYPVEVIRRYVFRYLTIVRAVPPKSLCKQELLYISSLLREYREKDDKTTRPYLKACVRIGRNLPGFFLYGFIRLLNTFC